VITIKSSTPAPSISSVSTISTNLALGMQFTISGSNLGTSPSSTSCGTGSGSDTVYSSTSPSFRVIDLGTGSDAWSGFIQRGGNTDDICYTGLSWGSTSITVTAATNLGVGPNSCGANYLVTTGDQLEITVFTPGGSAWYNTTATTGTPVICSITTVSASRAGSGTDAITVSGDNFGTSPDIVSCASGYSGYDFYQPSGPSVRLIDQASAPDAWAGFLETSTGQDAVCLVSTPTWSSTSISLEIADNIGLNSGGGSCGGPKWCIESGDSLEWTVFTPTGTAWLNTSASSIIHYPQHSIIETAVGHAGGNGNVASGSIASLAQLGKNNLLALQRLGQHPLSNPACPRDVLCQVRK
jgi:hypothetical protein